MGYVSHIMSDRAMHAMKYNILKYCAILQTIT